MTPAILDFIRDTAQAFSVRPGNALEIGSLDINGSVRDVFPGVQWLGIDRQRRKGIRRGV